MEKVGLATMTGRLGKGGLENPNGNVQVESTSTRGVGRRSGELSPPRSSLTYRHSRVLYQPRAAITTNNVTVTLKAQ